MLAEIEGKGYQVVSFYHLSLPLAVLNFESCFILTWLQQREMKIISFLLQHVKRQLIFLPASVHLEQKKNPQS